MRLWFLVFALVFAYPVNSIVINEIMYDPTQSDDYNEWIELYNDEGVEINLENFTVCGSALLKGFVNQSTGNTQLNTTYILPMNGFAVVTDGGSGTQAYDNFSISNSSIALHVSPSSICTGLSNTGDIITIEMDSTVYDSITYSNKAVETEGRSLCRNTTFVECTPTPGYTNSLLSNTTNQTTGSNQTNSTGTCDVSIGIITGSTTYGLETIYFDLFLNSTNCTQKSAAVNYFVEDLFGNIVKSPVNTSVDFSCSYTSQKQWTPDEITGSEAYNIKASIVSSTCNDTTPANNNASKTVIVKGNTIQSGSSIAITSTPSSVKYGETADIELIVYRGDTSRYAIDVWVDDSGKKLSQVSTLHAGNKFTQYKFQVPVQMKSNCDNSLNDGTYTVVAEGLNITASHSIAVSGTSSSVCKTITVSSGSSSSSSGGGSSSGAATQRFSYGLKDYTQSISAGEEFTTTIALTNNFTIQKNFTIYSYVYSGNNPVSLGFDETKKEWMGTYTANLKSFLLDPGKTREITLMNRIENDTDTGTYSFRVRIKVDGKDNDITKEMTVTERKPLAVQAVAVNGTANAVKNSTNTTNTTVTKPQQNKIEKSSVITGFAAKKNSYINPLRSPIELLVDYLLSLFQ